MVIKNYKSLLISLLIQFCVFCLDLNCRSSTYFFLTLAHETSFVYPKGRNLWEAFHFIFLSFYRILGLVYSFLILFQVQVLTQIQIRFYLTPVLPKPPAPLSVLLNSSTLCQSARSCFAMTSCAMRSPFSTVKASLERFTKMTPISPR
jgi:hypothetical protein